MTSAPEPRTSPGRPPAAPRRKIDPEQVRRAAPARRAPSTERMRASGTRRASGTASTMSSAWMTQWVSAPSAPPPGGSHACRRVRAEVGQQRGGGQRAVARRHRVGQAGEVAAGGLELRHEGRRRSSAPASSRAPRPRGCASPRTATGRPTRRGPAASSRSARATYSSATAAARSRRTRRSADVVTRA